MKIGRTTAFAAVMLMMLGGVIIASSLGLFDTESSKNVATIKAGEFAGEADPNDIRGSFSFADISRQFGVEISALAEAFGIDGTDDEIAAFQIKGLEEKYAGLPQEIGTSSVRLFVGFMTSLPVELGAYIPVKAAEIIISSVDGLTEERESYLKGHTIDLTAVPKQSEGETLPEEAQGSSVPAQEGTVSGFVESSVKAASPQESKAADPKPAAEAAPAAATKESPAATDDGIVDATGVADAAKTTEATAEQAGEDSAAGQQAAAEEHDTKKEERSVKGNTTIFDMMSWGVSRELIGPAIGIELPADNGAKLRDLIIAAGKSFEEAKLVLQKMVDESN